MDVVPPACVGEYTGSFIGNAFGGYASGVLTEAGRLSITFMPPPPSPAVLGAASVDRDGVVTEMPAAILQIDGQMLWSECRGSGVWRIDTESGTWMLRHS